MKSIIILAVGTTALAACGDQSQQTEEIKIVTVSQNPAPAPAPAPAEKSEKKTLTSHLESLGVLEHAKSVEHVQGTLAVESGNRMNYFT